MGQKSGYITLVLVVVLVVLNPYSLECSPQGVKVETTLPKAGAPD